MPTLRERLTGAIAAFRAKPPTRQEMTTPRLMLNPRVAASEAWVRNTALVVQTKSLRIFDQMRNDDMVKAAMSLKKQFIIAGGWDVESPEGAPEDWEVTEFVEEALKRVDGAFSQSLLQILTALDYGFSVTEKVYEPYDGKLWLKKLSTVSPHDIQFKMNEYGELLAIQQMGNVTNKVEDLPLGKFVLFTWDSDFTNPYGTSDLAAVHRPYIMKSQAYNWLAMMLERYGVPPVFVHYNQEAIPKNVQDGLLQALRDWQIGGFGLFPRGENKDAVEFYTPEIAGQVSSVFVPALTMFNTDIARGLLMPGLLGVTPDAQQGSFARANVSFDVFMLVVEHARSQLADVIIQEQIIKPLVDLNFAGVTEYPKFKWRPLSDDVRVDLINAWGTLTGQRVVQTTPADEAHIRKQLRFPELATAHDSAAEMEPGSYGPQAMAPAAGETPEGDAKEDPEDPEADAPEEGDKEEADTSKKKLSEERRALTTHEMKVNFTKIENDFDELQDTYIRRLKRVMEDMRGAVMSDIRRDWTPTLEFATSYAKLPKTDDLLTEVSAFLNDGMQRGRESLIRELPGAKFAEASLPDADLDDALAYLRAKAFYVSGVTDQKVLTDVRQALLQGVSNGETLDEIMGRIREIFKPYVEESRDAAGVLLEPSRLETIVRTNLTDVYNQGRMVQGAQAEEYLEGWQYSAILDSRTTEVCKHMDGKVFLADDKRAMALRPPRHFNCRSLMVPIVVGETINEDEKITDAQVREAKDLSGSGF
jgi:SPP1 gp7 family putative phage head morphogenesis protein